MSSATTTTSPGQKDGIRARAAAAKTPEYPTGLRMFPSSETGGVLPMSIVGRFAKERERLGPEFTEAERKWRIKWFRDQQLHHSEPMQVPKLYRALRNPLRRWYQRPLNHLEQQILRPRIGKEWAFIVRQMLGKGTLVYLVSVYTWYWMKYGNRTWERPGGLGIRVSRSPSYPGDPTYPVIDPRPNPEDYHDYGFSKQPFHRTH